MLEVKDDWDKAVAYHAYESGLFHEADRFILGGASLSRREHCAFGEATARLFSLILSLRERFFAGSWHRLAEAVGFPLDVLDQLIAMNARLRCEDLLARSDIVIGS
jgi:hypothetical protein